MVFRFFRSAPKQDVSSLLSGFRDKGYRLFGGMENAPETLEWGGWIRRVSKKPGEEISNALMFSRLSLLLAMHDFNFPLGFGRSVDQAFTDGNGDCGLDGVALAVGNTAIYSCDDVCRVIDEDPAAPVRILFHKAILPNNPEAVQCDEDISNFRDDILFWLREPEDKVSDRRNKGKEDINRQAREQWRNYNCLRKCYEKLGREFTPEITVLLSAEGILEDEGCARTAICQIEENIHKILPHSVVRADIWGKQQVQSAADYARIAVNRMIHSFSSVKMPTVELPDDWNSVATQGQPVKIQGFIGHVPAQELLKVFMKQKAEEGSSVPGLDYRFFRDSPRHYLDAEQAEKQASDETAPGSEVQQGWNSGAREIERSLLGTRESGVLPGQPALIGYGHNGIVIMARKVMLRPDTKEAQINKIDSYELIAPQVINGAQTCFVMHRHWDKLPGVFLPVKVIVCASYNVKDYIIEASNTQHPVDVWDMFTRRPEIRTFQRKFRHRFHSDNLQIWLQRRRNKPFEEIVDIDRTVIARDLLEATVSCFYNVPHEVEANPTQFLERTGGKVRFGIEIFSKEHVTEAYQAIGWLLVASRRFRRSLEKDALMLPRNYHVYALWRLVDHVPGCVVLRDRSESLCFVDVMEAIRKDINENNCAMTSLAAKIVWEEIAAGHRGAALTQAIIARTEKTA